MLGSIKPIALIWSTEDSAWVYTWFILIPMGVGMCVFTCVLNMLYWPSLYVIILIYSMFHFLI